MPKQNGAYTVGYRKPPRRRQFKKGQSGNPSGHHKAVKSFVALMAEALDEKVLVKESGKKKWISKREALAKQFANKGAAGDPRTLKLLIEVMQVIDQRRGVDHDDDLYHGGNTARDRLDEKLRKLSERIQARQAEVAASQKPSSS
jgi:ribosome-associated translation inhibitor RaiA